MEYFDKHLISICGFLIQSSLASEFKVKMQLPEQFHGQQNKMLLSLLFKKKKWPGCVFFYIFLCKSLKG